MNIDVYQSFPISCYWFCPVMEYTKIANVDEVVNSKVGC